MDSPETYVVRMARVLNRTGSVIMLELFTDDEYPISIEDGDEFISVGVKRALLV